ncbi:rhomboid family intramembrane serine protease [Aggregicoccus sp. 17bor-14]|uniref:rhomboid family intramembrane serine protease n=1 Tax=Myxococcaceae TaxID=31 RepID=UPI00129D02F4|nr:MULTISPECIES: rhomboid family intramembrane serine protease [Myxococcaceae]MBF5045577.1 rhomboid family intramembrane serine protease [Simulacricoccus sp. 17bor-14]MRI91314.1 rhomboid family intramembrane serine protease [Aggregicoccus sp. 17bor-14]
MVSPREPRRVLEPVDPLEPLPTQEQTPVPARRIPWVCGFVMAASVALFLLQARLAIPVQVSGGGVEEVPRFALFGPWVQAGQYWRLLSCAFEHGGALHIFFNMSVVYSLGFGLERAIGSARFLLISVVSALGASAFSLFFNFHTVMLGASGMILGWAGAMLLLVTREGRRSLGVWLAQIAVISLIPGVSWAGHLGGFLFGLPCGFALKKGPQVFRYAAPVILFVTAVVAFVSAHPERFGLAR